MDAYFKQELEAVRNELANFPPNTQDTAAKILLPKLLDEFGQTHRLTNNVFRTEDRKK